MIRKKPSESKHKTTASAYRNLLALPTSWEFITFISVLFVGLAIVQTCNNSPEYFTFRPNGYAALSFLEIAINAVLLVMLYYRKGNQQARGWFSVVILGDILLGFGETLQRLSSSPSQALLWVNLTYIGTILIPVGYYMFAHTYTDKKNAHQDAYLPTVILGSAAVLLLFVLGSESRSTIGSVIQPWGYDPTPSLQFVLLTTWLGVVVSLGIYKFIRYGRETNSEGQKALSRIIVFGSCLALGGAVFFDIVPRFFGIHIVPLGVLFQAILPVGVIYAIFKYDTFALDLSSVVEDIFETLAEGLIITSRSLKVQMVNRFALDMSGFTEDSLHQKSIRQLFEPLVYKNIITTMRQQMPTSKVVNFDDTYIVDSSGRHIAVNISVTKLQGSMPAYLFAFADISQIKKYYGLEQKRNDELKAANENFRNQQQAMLNLLEDSRDISEQLQQEKVSVEQKVEQRTAEVRAERARLEASINSLDIGFTIVDKNKKILTANGAFKSILGIKPDEHLAGIKQVEMELHGSYDLVSAVEQCLKTGKNATKYSIQFGEKVIRIFIAPIFEDVDRQVSLGAVVLLEDITEAKAIERSRDEFFSIASHELRTPLTAIRGNTQMMMDYYKEALSDPDLKDMVADIHDSSIRLITIVNDFLDTSRLEQGKISFQLAEFDVRELVGDVVQEFKAGEVNPALYINVTTQKELLPLVKADRDRLKQTVINLVGNGFKFTDTGGVIINLRADETTVFIEVSDSGKGIPEESRNLLFRKFQQASNNILTRDSTRSTGLGLYISKLIVEGMAGKIYLASSELGKGSTFTIEIPVAKGNISASLKS